MDLKHLMYFSEVVRHNSFSKAAEKLYISQPNISNVVKDLEKELDVKLLIRTTRKIEPTDAGKLLYQYCQQIFQNIKQFNLELDDLRNSKKGYVKMGIFPMLGTKLLSKMIADFYKLYPKVRVQFIEDNAANLQLLLNQGELDLVIMPYPIEKAEYDFFPFLKGDLRILVHETHPFNNMKNVKWSDLTHENFIIFREGFTIHENIIDECRKVGFEPYILCETSQWNFMMELVSINQGITILPQAHYKEIDDHYFNLNVLPLVEPKINWKLGVAWRKDNYQSFAARTWIEFLKQDLDKYL